MKRPLLGVLLLVALPGCSIEKMAADSMVPVLVRTKDAFNRETVPRYAREAAPGLIATLNGLVATSPDNPELRLLQAELNASFAFAFLEEEDPVWATAHYRRAQEAALAALADEDEELAAALPTMPVADLVPTKDRPTTRLDEELDEDAVPALFWWAFARGSEINLHRGDPARVGDLGRVDAVMKWVLARDETYFNAGPHAYFAMRNLALPPSFGGEPDVGLAHFEAIDRITGGRHLLAKVLRCKFHAPMLASTEAGASVAETLAAQRAAWDAFYNGLKAVIEAPEDLWPEQALSNAVARQRARALLARPEDNNIITPDGAVNEFAPAAEDDAWGAGDASGSADDGGGDWALPGEGR